MPALFADLTDNLEKIRSGRVGNNGSTQAEIGNNIAQHFATAWLDVELKGDAGKAGHLDLLDIGREGVWSVNQDGAFKDDHTYWAGFAEGAAEGLRYEVLAPAPAPVPLPASLGLLGLALGGLGVMRGRRGRTA